MPPGPDARLRSATLRFTLEHPLALALFTLLLIGGILPLLQHTGSDLLPAMDEGGFIVDYIMPAVRRSRKPTG